MSMFDYVTGITIGNIAAEMATELEKNPLFPVLAMVIYGVLDYVISLVSSKSIGFRKKIVGEPLLLMDNGTIYRENLKKARLDISDFLTLCRVSGYFSLSQIQTAIFEYNGNISFLPTSQSRPVTPQDMNLQPNQEYAEINVIMDGYIMPQNLKAAGKDENWLQKNLKEQGYKSEQEVFIATVDSDGNLSVYPMDREKKKVFWFE